MLEPMPSTGAHSEVDLCPLSNLPVQEPVLILSEPSGNFDFRIFTTVILDFLEPELGEGGGSNWELVHFPPTYTCTHAPNDSTSCQSHCIYAPMHTMLYLFCSKLDHNSQNEHHAELKLNHFCIDLWLRLTYLCNQWSRPFVGTSALASIFDTVNV